MDPRALQEKRCEATGAVKGRNLDAVSHYQVRKAYLGRAHDLLTVIEEDVAYLFPHAICHMPWRSMAIDLALSYVKVPPSASLLFEQTLPDDIGAPLRAQDALVQERSVMRAPTLGGYRLKIACN